MLTDNKIMHFYVLIICKESQSFSTAMRSKTPISISIGDIKEHLLAMDIT